MSEKITKARLVKSFRPKIGITIGDFNGVGPEIIIKALSDVRINKIFTPVIYGSSKIITAYKKILNFEGFNFNVISDQNQEINDKKTNVINCWEDSLEITPGLDSQEAGRCAFLALEKATDDLKNKVIDAVVTAPINKFNIQSPDFKFAGHTEYFGNKFETSEYLMLMVSQALRVGVVTGHIPVNQISSSLNKEAILKKILVMIDSLKNDFGIRKPRIAVMGLNPHAGENGLLGTEDRDIITPVIEKLKNKGNLVFGPFPADGFFGSGQFKNFDGVMAMYHDQGLIPFKTLSFGGGVNYTAGLPVVRTSPDHGTAYSIAGKGIADHQSFMEALYLAADIATERHNKIENMLRV